VHSLSFIFHMNQFETNYLVLQFYFFRNGFFLIICDLIIMQSKYSRIEKVYNLFILIIMHFEHSKIKEYELMVIANVLVDSILSFSYFLFVICLNIVLRQTFLVVFFRSFSFSFSSWKIPIHLYYKKRNDKKTY